jgi:small-conductance mechanosensitive channel/CRP-like cAMP-binding protein
MTLTQSPKPAFLLRKCLAFTWPIAAIGILVWIDRNGTWGWLTRARLDKVAACGYILLGAVVFHHVICGLFIDTFLASSRKRPLPKLLRHLLAITVAAVACMLVARVVAPAAFTGIMTLSGILGIVLGLALKPLILDVFSGISTNLDSAFQIGDWIEIGERPGGSPYSGWVEEINWRTTHIRTRSGNLVICPNSEVGTAVITNFSRPWPLSRCEVLVQLPSEIDPSRLLRILQAAVDATVGAKNGPSSGKRPEVLLKEFKDGMAIYQVRFWIDYSESGADAARHVVNHAVLRHLQIGGIPLAVPAVLNRESGEAFSVTPVHGIRELLARIELFQGIGPDDISELAGSLASMDFSRGEILVSQADDGDEMFVLIEGAVEVLVTVDGAEVAVARMQAGDYFGEMSMLTGEPRTATVRALTDGKACRIPRGSMARLLSDDAHLLELVSRNLADRNLNRSAKIEEAQTQTPDEQRTGMAAALLAKMRRVFAPSR